MVGRLYEFALKKWVRGAVLCWCYLFIGAFMFEFIIIQNILEH